MVACRSYLNEQDFPTKIVNDLLVTLGVPPLDCAVVFPSGADDPNRESLPDQLPNL